MALSRVAAFCARRARGVLLFALALSAVAGALGAQAAGSLQPFSSDAPEYESVKARDALAGATGVDPYFDVVVLVRDRRGVRRQAARARVRRVAALLERDPAVIAVRSMLRGGGPRFVARDGRSTFVLAGMRPAPMEQQLDAARRLEDRLAREPNVLLGGRASFYARGNDTAREDLLRVELVALPLLVLIALWVFRGVVAALLPLAVAAVTVAGAFLGLRVAGESMDVSIYALNIVTALGLGLAVDYSLLLLSRYREEAAAHGHGRTALDDAVRAAGRTILFSSLTVAGAASALLVFPQPFLRSIAIGAMLVAVLAGAAALVVLPALVALLGPRLDSLSPARWRSSAERASRPDRSGGWYRLSRFVMRRPLAVALASSVLLLGLALPIADLRLTQVDWSVVPESSPDRRVAEALDREFAPNLTSPVYALIRAPTTAAVGRSLRPYARRLRSLRGSASVTPPRAVGRGVWRVDATPRGDPLSAGSQELVRAARGIDLPFPVLVGGESASLVDLKASLGDALPAALTILVALTFLGTFLATRSVVLPFKTLVMNALTLGATFGVMVLVFQRGGLEDLLGYTSSGALEASVVVLILVVAFGLATDYGLFLLTRIREERERGAADREAIAMGLERTGRIVTAAAMLLCVALASLVFARHALVKETGVGTALAVAIDASIVRALLVPSLMMLMGRLNWWAPTIRRSRQAGAGGR